MSNRTFGTLTIEFALPGWGLFGLLPRAMRNLIIVRGECVDVEVSSPFLPHLKPADSGDVGVKARSGYAYGERLGWTT